jgi:hypothetical protein
MLGALTNVSSFLVFISALCNKLYIYFLFSCFFFFLFSRRERIVSNLSNLT